MLYISTRGQGDMQPSAHVIKEGLAKDGGLFVPQRFPGIHVDDILALHSRSYQDCAAKILGYFLTDYSSQELAACTAGAYAAAKFGPDPAPLVRINDKIDTLELWHGPTSAFKDMALQLLPRLLSKALLKTGEDTKSLILVATSGDTGKAALEGFADVPNTEIIVFYPSQGVSPMQKKQMTTQTGSNVHVYGIEGNFDDAQKGVKEILNNQELNAQISDHGYTFSSANSINWGRLVPQIVYYFKSYATAVATGRVQPRQPVNFAVPTGNFGDILAGYYAKKMGLPVQKLICASNSNNVLTDFLATGIYDRRREFHKTMSPSMDILVSSNLERLLFDVTGGDSERVAAWMQELQTQGFYTVAKEYCSQIKDSFFGAWVDEVETAETISRTFNDTHYVLDPHTAVAYRALEKYRLLTSDETYSIVLSTASPYKFSSSVLAALGKKVPAAADLFTAVRELEQLTSWKVPAGLSSLETKTEQHLDVIPSAKMGAAVLQSLDLL
ncbi:MAG: threonine synthase [Acidaminococcaceae bacterium]|jgi:threonine synthase|nr:threonine synthase [Acidaminococcaceae bacterium]